MTKPPGRLADPAFRHARAKAGGRARTTPTYHLNKVRELVTASRAAQGLPPTVEDVEALDRIAAILAQAVPDEAA